MTDSNHHRPRMRHRAVQFLRECALRRCVSIEAVGFVCCVQPPGHLVHLVKTCIPGFGLIVPLVLVAYLE